MTQSARPELSIVAPLHNEAEVVQELAYRCLAAACQCGPDFEIVLVDDASTDSTPRMLAELADSAQFAGRLRVVTLQPNRGQYGATVAGLLEAKGQWIAVLDGDLQDPPETIGDLWRRAIVHPPVDVVQAVKRRRDEPAWFRFAAGLLHFLQRTLAAVTTTPNAGSFCMLRASLRDQVVQVPIRRANLAAVLAALRPSCGSVMYAKAARSNGPSRVGLPGLIAEAIGSLWITGALERLLGIAALGSAAAARMVGGAGLYVAAGAMAAVGVAAGLSRARHMRPRPASRG